MKTKPTAAKRAKRVISLDYRPGYRPSVIEEESAENGNVSSVFSVRSTVPTSVPTTSCSNMNIYKDMIKGMQTEISSLRQEHMANNNTIRALCAQIQALKQGKQTLHVIKYIIFIETPMYHSKL